jgi:hypothetical protein
VSTYEGTYTSMWDVYAHMCEYTFMRACVSVHVRTYDYDCLYTCTLNRCSELYYSVIIPHFLQASLCPVPRSQFESSAMVRIGSFLQLSVEARNPMMDKV